MSWYIRKGQTVSSNDPILFDFYGSFSANTNMTFPMELIVCDSKKAPPGHSKEDSSTTKVLCSMLVTLSNVPKYLFKPKTSPQGLAYRNLDYQIGMQLESGGLKFDLRVDGAVYGKIIAKFDSD